MPRDIIKLDDFNIGLVLSGDPENIPVASALYSKDVWGETKFGKLTPRRQHSFSSVSTNNKIANAFAYVQRASNVFDYLIALEASGVYSLQSRLGSVVSGTTTTVDSNIPARVPAFVSNNKEVHIGLGDAPPKWWGYVDHGQFGEPASTSAIYTDGENKPPASLPFLHKVVPAGTKHYGVAFRGQGLIEIDSGDSIPTAPIFSDLRAICQSKTANRVWVLDYNGTSYHLKHAGTGTDFGSVFETIQINVILDDQASFTDIELTTAATNGTMYLAATSPVRTEVLYRWPINLAETIAVPTGVTPFNITDSGMTVTSKATIIQKIQVASETNVTDGQATPDFDFWTSYSTHRRSLTRMGTTSVGWIFSMRREGAVSGSVARSIIRSYTGETVNGHAFAFDTVFQVNDADAARTIRANIYNGLDATGVKFFENFDGSTVNYTGPVYMGTNDFAFSGLFLATFADLATAFIFELPPGKLSKAPVYSGIPSHMDGSNFLLVRDEGSSGVDVYSSFLTKLSTLVEEGAFAATIRPSGLTGNFQDRQKYYYRFAFEYDGYQVSPLSGTTWVQRNEEGDTSDKIIRIGIADKTEVSPRVSAVLVFRGGSHLKDGQPDGYYRLVHRAPLSHGWVVDGDSASVVFNDSNENTGQSYEAWSGIPETATTSMVKYGVSAKLDSTLFVADCYIPEVDDARRYLFRSRPFRYSTFNIAFDWLILPFVPISMVPANGRLFVFGEKDMAIVHPELYIEDYVEGIGIATPHAIANTPAGIFIGSPNHVYHIQPQGGMVPISIPVNTKAYSKPNVTDISYQELLKGYVRLFFDYNTNYLLVARDGFGSLAYHVGLQRWDYFSHPTASTLGFLRDKTNSTFFMGVESLHRLFSHGAQPFEWYSKILLRGSQNMKIYKVFPIQAQSGTTTLQYSVDGGTTFKSLTNGNLATADWLKKEIIVKVNSDVPVNSIDIVYRDLVGAR